MGGVNGPRRLRHRMQMVIVEPRHQHVALQVDTGRRVVLVRKAVIPHGQDFAVLDDDRGFDREPAPSTARTLPW